MVVSAIASTPQTGARWIFQWKQYSSQRNNKSWKQRTETSALRSRLVLSYTCKSWSMAYILPTGLCNTIFQRYCMESSTTIVFSLPNSDSKREKITSSHYGGGSWVDWIYVGYCTCCPIIIQSAEAKLNPEAVRHGMSDPRKSFLPETDCTKRSFCCIIIYLSQAIITEVAQRSPVLPDIPERISQTTFLR